jgi:hypothetical protein
VLASFARDRLLPVQTQTRSPPGGGSPKPPSGLASVGRAVPMVRRNLRRDFWLRRCVDPLRGPQDRRRTFCVDVASKCASESIDCSLCGFRIEVEGAEDFGGFGLIERHAVTVVSVWLFAGFF